METTKAILAVLNKSLTENYAKQLDGFGKALKPKTREALLSGFQDGVGNGIRHTCAMLGVTVKE